MATTQAPHTLRSYADALAHAAHGEDGLPERLAQRAREITARNLSDVGSGELDPVARRRVRNYYHGVMRRLVARSNEPGVREYRLRAMAASVAADLEASGAEQDRVSREVSAWLGTQQGAA